MLCKIGVGEGKEHTRLKISPNLSETRMVCVSAVNSMEVGFLGSSLYK